LARRFKPDVNLFAAARDASAARGDQAFLHAWKTNETAVSLYERLGFTLRSEVNIAVLKRRD
jgi:ribosomal protein S18 acetylase RimI-like enzyme